MRTLRTIGMALVAVVLSFSFAACGDDDDDDDDIVNNENVDKADLLLGSWFITDIEGSYYNEETKEWERDEEHYDMKNPQEGALKMEISPTSEKDMQIWTESEYYDGKWDEFSPKKAVVRGNIIVSGHEDPSYDTRHATIQKLTKEKFSILVEKSDSKTIWTFTRYNI